MHTVTSADGTPIAFERSGAGPPLVLVHGATADHSTTWRYVLPLFAERFAVYAMDRRGRGGSGDSAAYGLQREAEDVAAVVDSIGGPVNVLGHSFGALCALEAALLSPHVRRLVLYEGVPLRGGDLYDPETVRLLYESIDRGDREGALTGMYRDIVGMPDEQIRLLRSQEEAWAARLRNVSTLPRELEAERTYVFRTERYADLRVPTLLLLGGDSPPREFANAEGVTEALPDARIVLLSGQGHAAMHTDPQLLADEVLAFLGS